MSAATKLLDRLDRPRRTRPGNWLAGCPCCKSKQGRPLSVRETDEGRVLLYAFCGCTIEAVLGALGLGVGDLFDKPLGTHFAPSHSRIPARDLLTTISDETSVVAIIVNDLLKNRKVSESDLRRLAQAASRIGAAKDHAR